MHGCRLTILYGSVKSDDIVLKDELDQICAECPDVKVVHVLSGDPDWPGEHGFITREIIEKYAAPNSTFLVWPAGHVPVRAQGARGHGRAAAPLPPRRGE